MSEPAQFGFVLAGGASVRMGTDKARLCFPDQLPMAIVVAEAMRAAGLKVSLVRHVADDFEWRFVDGERIPVVLDEHPERHSLNGIIAGLQTVGEDAAVFAPCDMPFLSAATFQRLADLGDAVGVNAVSGTDRHPLLCGLRGELLPKIRGLREQNGRARTLLEWTSAVELAPEECRNINSLS